VFEFFFFFSFALEQMSLVQPLITLSQSVIALVSLLCIFAQLFGACVARLVRVLSACLIANAILSLLTSGFFYCTEKAKKR
jgi:hypothetical protein